MGVYGPALRANEVLLTQLSVVELDAARFPEVGEATDLAQWWPLANLHQIQLVELVELALGWTAA